MILINNGILPTNLNLKFQCQTVSLILQKFLNFADYISINYRVCYQLMPHNWSNLPRLHEGEDFTSIPF